MDSNLGNEANVMVKYFNMRCFPSETCDLEKLSVGVVLELGGLSGVKLYIELIRLRHIAILLHHNTNHTPLYIAQA